MFRFSLYPGEGHSLDEQLEMCIELGFNNLEISDCMDGKLFLDMDCDSIIKKAVFNKVYIPSLNISAPLETYEMNDMKDIIRKCNLMGIEYLNIGDFNKYENGKKLLGDLTKYCEVHNVKLCVENRDGCYINENTEAFFKDSANSELYMAFNPLEFVRSGYHPFLNAFYSGRFKNRLCFLRICDGIYANGMPKLPGDGSAEIKELVSALHTRNFRGYISLCTYYENQTIKDYMMIFRRLCSLLSNM